MTDEEVQTAIDIAERNVYVAGDREVALMCLKEAIFAKDNKRPYGAYMWACNSIKASVGVFHPDYARARGSIQD